MTMTPGGKMQDTPIQISVVIVNYNVRELLANALHSVEAAMRDIRGEIFVVDNASDDGSAELVETHFPLVQLIANSENVGFAKANNQALSQARGRYILILNPDTLLQEDTLSVLMNFLETNPDVGMAGCKIINADGSYEPNSRRSFPSPWVSFTKITGLSALFPKSRLFGRYNLTYLSDDETYEVDALSGCVLMLRREVYERIGGFDESYFMYGEDLDWCYRAQRAGWKIYYVHSTKIIHYSGESTRRSNIDSRAIFYDAMRLFVTRNLRLSFLSRGLINSAIYSQLFLSRLKRIALPFIPVLVDALFVVLAIMLGEVLRFGVLFRFPTYAYPTVYIASIVIYIFSLSVAGTYSRQSHTIGRSTLGVIAGFLIMSSLTFFFKDFAFSRGVVLIGCGLLLVFIPGIRFIAHAIREGSLPNLVSGNPTVLVGITDQTEEIIQKLRSSQSAKYNLIGLIDVDRRRIEQTIGGIPIIGSTANIGKILFERRVSDVIFTPDVLPYAEMLGIISRTKKTAVRYRVIARSLDMVVGKSSIDQLSAGVPLIDVEYNLLRTMNAFYKRTTDVLVSSFLMLTAFPIMRLVGRRGQSHGWSLRSFVLQMPQVFRGKRSLVGRFPATKTSTAGKIQFGKEGVTGLVHIMDPDRLSAEEIVTLELQYARNYSLFLDLEILPKTAIQFMKKGKR